MKIAMSSEFLIKIRYFFGSFSLLAILLYIAITDSTEYVSYWGITHLIIGVTIEAVRLVVEFYEDDNDDL